MSSTQQFEGFDWVNNEKWQSYLSNLYPTPPADRINYFKKKWYKKEIDPSFEITSEMPPTASSSTEQTVPPRPAASSPPPSSPQPANSLERIATMLLCGGIIFGAASILPIALSGRLRLASLALYIFGFCASICGDYGIPKFQWAYWERILMSDAAQAIVMTIMAIMLAAHLSFLSLLSPTISAVIIAADGLLKITALHPKVVQYARQIQGKKYQLFQQKADIEAWTMIIMLVLALTGRVPFVLGFLYFNIMRFKYTANGYAKSAWQKIDRSTRYLLGKPVVPRVLYTVYDKVSNMLYRLGNPQPTTR
eukprot:Protomagalhaensia_sp_Gyna_25__1298@NODE_1651_length_1657_cov_420_383807_g1350_i0_p1_GENE_NODE_1651_length_1657_cov_420_383807_g1350_i0NODE_1651_length_1657_cov_420_383807_g1350_i0_p1_ORF_typecomplete_len308_score52_21UPF0121/PF03661_13/2_9e20Alpha_GJ/PF03229_13/0_061DUF1240/PF06836_12/1_3e03DUF1240/PF06836_12/1_3_NODE_1651_length_1657_cov_420_383807_g1350_i046969